MCEDVPDLRQSKAPSAGAKEKKADMAAEIPLLKGLASDYPFRI